MKCDVCQKFLTQAGTIVRFTSEQPNERIRSLLVIHRACDTRPWPAANYGHIDVRALDKQYLLALHDRVVVEAQKEKLCEAWQAWGYHGETYDEVVWPDASFDDMPF